MNYKHFVSVIASQLSCSPLQRLLKVEPATDSFLCSLSLSLPHQNLICNFPSSHCTALICTSPEIPAMTMRGLRDGALRQALLIFYDYLHRAKLVFFHQAGGCAACRVAWLSSWGCALKVKYLIWLLQRPCDGKMTRQWDAG